MSAASIPSNVLPLAAPRVAATSADRPARAEPTPEAVAEARAAAEIHEARVALWERLLGIASTLPRLAARGVELDDSAIAPCVARLGRPTLDFAQAETDRRTLAGWLAEHDRPLEHATALLACGDAPRVVQRAWQELQRRRGAFASSHSRLVSGIVRRFAGRGIDREDLVQEGTVGLLRAVDRFDHTRGVRFATYATWWIRNSLAQLVCGGRLVRVPPQTRRAQFRLIRLYEEAEQRGDAAPSTASLAAEGLSERIVRRLHLVPGGAVQPIDPARDLDGSDGNVGRLPGADEHVEHQSLLAAIARSITALSARQRLVLERRFGLDGRDAATLTEIGQDLSITAERVRQIEKSALETLRRALLEEDPELPLTAARSPRRMSAAA